ncbi:putative Zn-dependent protease with MMP-like domain [Rubricella aquisinus]|uniref:Putative Zn-dependent protease with MMP-like domain n=1 Tax=Rubricella aquisinus TaxID=2028108 RepID=A0A840WRT1_9RHOB|nr:putative Zn-dependent protease with MMP-like domain [Rubricella aquisinus]
MQNWDMEAPSLGDIADIAEAARAALPDPWRAGAQSVLLQVADFADDDVLREMGEEDAFALTGLYDGIPVTQKSVADVVMQPDTIWLFRRAILDEWCGRGDVTLTALVTHVFVHELAHHFGWSDEDIAAIDRWWE